LGLSVIVTAYRSPETLRACVERLRADSAVTQILVVDCSETPPDLALPFERAPVKTPVPVMRWSMLPRVTEPVVACLEGRCVPPPGWGAAILEAHAKHPRAKAIGGAVSLGANAGFVDELVWLCEYAAFAPRLADREAAGISGAHLSYKTEALRAEIDLLEAGAWETRIHLRWRGALRTAPVAIEFFNGMSLGAFLKQRLHYGRGYAAARGVGILFGFATPLLPFVLTARTCRAARVKPLLIPAVFLAHAAWSVGELLGYWFGASSEKHIF
jgi:hypothetical protein